MNLERSKTDYCKIQHHSLRLFPILRDHTSGTMERTLSSLAYKGSVPEAISEARKQRKLFVVYISGEDVASSNLESSTWTDQKVAEAISKYCILLHLSEGSNDAAQFSAIFPQMPTPCITVVGYNGIQLWQNGGFVSGEVLASSLEKVWLSLHIQDSTAAVLTAALASKTSEPSTSVVASSAPSEAESSTVSVKPPSSNEHNESSDAKVKARPEKRKERSDANDVEDKGGEVKNVSPSKSVQAENVGSTNGKSTKSGKEHQLPNAVTNGPSSRALDSSQSHKTGSYVDDDVRISHGGSKLLNNTKAVQAVQDLNDEAIIEDKKTETIDKSSDVHLNIRMPHGSNLQEKFPVSSTLRMVKQFVDNRKESAFGPYDLAIPYPRKVYDDQDLSRTLSELELFDRQALIVVPRQRTTTRSNPRTIVEPLNESDTGYFSYVKRILSFVNPFSYLGGGGPSSTDSVQQYQRVPSVNNSETMPQNNIPTPSRAYSMGGGSGSRSRQPTASRFGSNIHTLKRDEDDEQFKDRNSFWNGNSTEYGGNDNGK